MLARRSGRRQLLLPDAGGSVHMDGAVRPICGSGKSSTPLSRMHWANSNAASRSGSLDGGADAPAASTVATAAVAAAKITASRESLIDVPSREAVDTDDDKPGDGRGISGTSLADPGDGPRTIRDHTGRCEQARGVHDAAPCWPSPDVSVSRGAGVARVREYALLVGETAVVEAVVVTTRRALQR